MELIPILSTIILVATISTFLLAIGAYILYKVREKKGQAATITPPQEVEAELVTPAAAPAPAPQPVVERERIISQPIFIESQSASTFQKQPAAKQGPSPVQPRPQPYTAYKQPFKTASAQQNRTVQTGFAQRGSQSMGNRPLTEEERKLKDSKFLKYTSEGYVPATEDKDAGALKWR